MAIQFEEEIRNATVNDVANQMMIAARTAPKAKGIDNLIIAKITKEEITIVAEKMKSIVVSKKAGEFFLRDADNILQAECVVLIGTRIKSTGVQHCGLCGFMNCEEKDNYPKIPCHYNSGDLGIAVGSAVSIASDFRIDNRIMRSVGKAVKLLNMLGEEAEIIYGIPLSSTSKNPFFDR